MLLNEKYLAQFERNSGLKKGTVSKHNYLFETYMSDARANGDDYKFFIVMDLNGESKIIGGNEYKQDAIDGANEYLESGIRLKVYSLQYLKGKKFDPNNDGNWGNQGDINAAMKMAADGGTSGLKEAIAGVPSQQDVDDFQASEYEGNDEPENDKDMESQDAMHLGEGEMDAPNNAKENIIRELLKPLCTQNSTQQQGQLNEKFMRDFMRRSGVKKLNENYDPKNVSNIDVETMKNHVLGLIPELSGYTVTSHAERSYNVSIFTKEFDRNHMITFRVETSILPNAGATEENPIVFQFGVGHSDARNGTVFSSPIKNMAFFPAGATNNWHYAPLSQLKEIAQQASAKLHEFTIQKQQDVQDDMQGQLDEIDNMMAGHDSPSSSDMGSSGNSWMDGPNDNQMNSLGDGEGEELGEGWLKNLVVGGAAAATMYGAGTCFVPDPKVSHDAAAKETNSNYHSYEDERALHAYNAKKDSIRQAYTNQQNGLKENKNVKGMALNESSKALYAKAKVDESQYERFLRNADIKK